MLTTEKEEILVKLLSLHLRAEMAVIKRLRDKRMLQRKQEKLVAPPVVKKARTIYERPVYKNSTWWTMLAKGECKILGHPQSKLFRRRFAVPFSTFRNIVEEARSWMSMKGNLDEKLGDSRADCRGTEGVPLELKILGALRMLAKGCSFDAIAELSGMSISTMQPFFHYFWNKFTEVYREIWIKYPKTPEEAADNLAVYRRLGFPGAVGSVDCTHVLWERCPAQFQSTYTGKEKKATVAYEVTVNHSRRILHISDGHPGSRNDKTIVKTDTFVQELKDRKILKDVEFQLFKVRQYDF